MNANVKRILFWTPRVLCLLFAAFLSIFAFDVFDEGHGFWKTALALAIHLIPALILLAALALCWRWEWIGAILFPALGVFYLVATWGRFPWFTYAVIAGPLLLLGMLFLLSWRLRKTMPTQILKAPPTSAT